MALRTPILRTLFVAGAAAIALASALAAIDDPIAPRDGAVALDDGKLAPIDYARDVRPILSRRCFPCHGPDEAARKAGLRLDVEEGQRGELKTGDRAIVAGDLDASELWARVTAEDEKRRMPPAKTGARLAPEQLSILERWIKEGAPFSVHWSLRKPERPAAPTVKNAAWPRSDLDRFVLAKLEAEGLAPAEEADRRTLLRRVSLDLVGLPPAPEEVEEFVADRAPDAYERRVDSLLHSPSFGEHWARVWLDLARFADTRGYEKDQRRAIWPWRDWLIRALDDDLPSAKFTEKVLAGDLLPGHDESDVIATAFHRNTMTNDEGGTDDEEFRVAAVKDRVDTTMQVWMGFTAGCAKCHDHKYDPLTQREYYQLYSFFNQSADADRGDDSPNLAFLTEQERSENAAIERQIDAAKARIESPEIAPIRQGALCGGNGESSLGASDPSKDKNPNWIRLHAAELFSEGGETLAADEAAIVRASGERPLKDVVTLIAPVPGPDTAKLATITALKLTALVDDAPDGTHALGRNPADPNIVVSELTLSVDGTVVPLAETLADFEQDAWPAAAAIDGKLETGWAVAPFKSEPHALIVKLRPPLALKPDARLAVRLAEQHDVGLLLARFRIDVTGDEKPRLGAEWDALATLKAKLHPAAQLPIMQELPDSQRRATRILVRGNFLDPGDPVEPAVPAAFHAWPDGEPKNRLGFAHWLTSPENPLAARALVNRYWARIFGRGLVETEEDFGVQGTPPSDPELLDWLACEFLARGGSFKELCRLIVTSSTYRESSRASAASLAKDPRNRWLARAPRFRFDAETVRDEALAVAGLLSPKKFGPSVMPYQPDGIWATVYSNDQWVTSPGEDRHRRSLYTFIKRTSPYPAMMTFDATSRETCTIRRIASDTPLQALVTLNDPVYVEAAQALARRAAADVGALADAHGHFEVSVQNAGDLLPDDAPEGRKSPQHIVARLFELALLRPPTGSECNTLLNLRDARSRWYRNHVEDARKMATDPLGPLPAGADAADVADLAAWTCVANAILNLDEFLTRG